MEIQRIRYMQKSEVRGQAGSKSPHFDSFILLLKVYPPKSDIFKMKDCKFSVDYQLRVPPF